MYSNKYSRKPAKKRFGYKKVNKNVKVWSVYELEKVVKDSQEKSVANPFKADSFIPEHTFSEFNLSDKLKNNIFAKGYKSPTPIQDKIIPIVLNKRDVIGIANTGTGKTAAFLIPLIELVLRDRSRKVLILTPVRELAVQIYEEFRVFSKDMRIFTSVLIGGTNIERQKYELQKNPSFAIATPGRLRDLLQRNAIRLDQYNTVVLDETDRMVDIGFLADIKYFIKLLPANRLSLFFSATVSSKVEEIINTFVRNPISVSVKSSDTIPNIEHKIVKVSLGENKIEVLHNILKKEECVKTLVFGSTKFRVQKTADVLTSYGHKIGTIHGNKTQSQRQTILRRFKTNEINILMATDVAARGLDIDGISHVINYDIPESYETYIHRVGRTGRVDKRGVALTLVT